MLTPAEEEYLSKIEMEEKEAREMCATIVQNRIRWGKQYDGGEFTNHKLIDAIVILAYSENENAANLGKELSRSNRQVAAANAREAKQKQYIEDLKKEIKVLQDMVQPNSKESG